MTTFDLDVVVMRGAQTESVHRVHAAVVDASDELVGSARDARTVAHWRSCAKPFQVMPLVESGALATLDWGDDELALACASHGGEPEHVALASRMLGSIALEEGDLVCGPHEPLTSRGLKLLRDRNERPSRLHNNCSGKHAAMLARARTAGWPTTGYERMDHPVQQAIVETLARWCALPVDRIEHAVDGCGAAVFVLPLDAAARAWARLASAAGRGDDVPLRIVHAMRTRPFLVGGTDRFDTVLMEETDGRVIAKVGAEGIHSAAVIDAGIGLTVKVEDGASRAQFPAVLRALQLLGALPTTLPPRLQEFLVRPVRNTRGETVGEVRPRR